MEEDLIQEPFIRRSTRVRRTPVRLGNPVGSLNQEPEFGSSSNVSISSSTSNVTQIAYPMEPDVHIVSNGQEVSSCSSSNAAKSVSSKSSARNRVLRKKKFLEQKAKLLRDQEKLLEEIRLNDDEFDELEKESEVQNEFNAESYCSNERTRQWINEQEKSVYQQENEYIQKESQESCTVKELVSGLCEALGKLSNKQPQSSDDSNMKILLARQSVGKELCSFSGNPEDWLMFISQYKKSTEVCKFSDEENMLRLQKALTGEARELCKALFVFPQNVGRILENLELRFGRPEYLIKSLMTKARNASPPRMDRPETIVKFSITIQNLVVNLQQLKMEEYMWNPQLIEDIESKLPSVMKFMWSLHKATLKSPLKNTLEDLASWLNNSAIAVCGDMCFEEKERQEKYRKPEENQNRKKYFQKEWVNASKEKIVKLNLERKCDNCDSVNHQIQDCEKFKEEDVFQRYKIAKERNLCFCCLSSKHPIFKCNKKIACKISDCQKIHHPLLHPEKVETISQAVCESKETLLRIIPVKIKGPKGEIKTFAILDSGSTASLIKESVAKEIGLEGKKESLCLQWANGDLNLEGNSIKVSLEISGTKENMNTFNISNVRTVSSLPLPKQTVNKEEIKNKWKYLSGVDFEEYFDGQPTILLGEDLNLLTVARKVIHGPWNAPIATKTWLGWVISGKSEKKNNFGNEKVVLHACERKEYKKVETNVMSTSKGVEDTVLIERKFNAIRRINDVKNKLEKNYEFASEPKEMFHQEINVQRQDLPIPRISWKQFKWKSFKKLKKAESN